MLLERVLELDGQVEVLEAGQRLAGADLFAVLDEELGEKAALVLHHDGADVGGVGLDDRHRP